jgi:hypothetical protein
MGAVETGENEKNGLITRNKATTNQNLFVFLKKCQLEKKGLLSLQ